MPTTPIVVVGSSKLQFKLLIVETPFDPLLNFAANTICTPFLTTSLLGATKVSTHVVIIIVPSD
jgi:hypothetical protein